MAQVPGESGHRFCSLPLYGAGPWGERPPVLFPSTVWRRSPTQVVQVSQLSGAGPIFPIGPAPLESTEATFAVQDPSIKTDLRQGAIGPAPAMEGRTSCNGGTCASNGGTCAIRERCSAEGQRPGRVHRNGGQRRAAAHRNGGQRRAAAHRNGGLQHRGPRRPLWAAIPGPG